MRHHIERPKPFGIPDEFCWHINTLTKGRAKVGALIGEIQATTGSVGTAELATSAVTAPKLANGAVTDIKRLMTWSTLGNTTASVTSVTVSSFGGFLVTNTGTSKGVVITGSTAGNELSIPTAGDHFRFVVDATPGTTRQIEIKSTGATFNAASAKVVGLSEVGQHVAFEAISATRWVVTQFSTGVTFAATT